MSVAQKIESLVNIGYNMPKLLNWHADSRLWLKNLIVGKIVLQILGVRRAVREFLPNIVNQKYYIKYVLIFQRTDEKTWGTREANRGKVSSIFYSIIDADRLDIYFNRQQNFLESIFFVEFFVTIFFNFFCTHFGSKLRVFLFRARQLREEEERQKRNGGKWSKASKTNHLYISSHSRLNWKYCMDP